MGYDPRQRRADVAHEIAAAKRELDTADINRPAEVFIEPSIVCPQCLRTSHNPNDIRERYCGHCHQFHDTMRPPLPQFKCDTYLLGCPVAYRLKCSAAQRCTGEDETMG